LEQGFYGSVAAAYLSGERSFDSLRKSDDALVGLMLQLKDRHGWQLYQKAFAAHRAMNRSQIPVDDVSKAQFFADVLSQAAGADLAPTLRDWGFPVQSKTTILGGSVAAYVGVAALVAIVALGIVIAMRWLPSKKERKPPISTPTTVKFCISCRNELPINAKFCDNCGASQQ